MKANALVTPNPKLEASTTVTDGGGVTPGALPVSVFGPVRKFRPVICRSVEKETSLHSSLMEAIQSGRGRDGLKVRPCMGWMAGWMDLLIFISGYTLQITTLK